MVRNIFKSAGSLLVATVVIAVVLALTAAPTDAQSRLPAPSAPRVMSARALSPTQVLLQWTPSTNVATYTIVGSTTNACLVVTVNSATMQYILTGISPGMQFTFVIQANGRGGVSRSVPVTVTTPALPVLTTINYTLASQRDPRWANNLMGNSGLRVGDYGCYMTSLAMGTNKSPATLNGLLSTRSGYTAAGDLVPTVAAVVTGTSYRGASVLGNAQSVKTTLLGGQIIIARSARSSQHWVLIISSDGTRVQYADPWDATIRAVGDGLVTLGTQTLVYQK